MRWLAVGVVAWLAGCLGLGPATVPSGDAEAGLDPGPPIVAFGDSYTSGSGARPSESYPSLLQANLGIRVVNLGVHGETALEGHRRIGDVLAAKPRLILVEFGVNEAFRGYPVARAEEGYRAILDDLSPLEVPVVLVGVHFAKYQGNFDAMLTNLGNEYGTGLVLDVLRDVLDTPGYGDAYHPNAAGYRVMEARIRPEVERMLAAGTGDR